MVSFEGDFDSILCITNSPCFLHEFVCFWRRLPRDHPEISIFQQKNHEIASNRAKKKKILLTTCNKFNSLPPLNVKDLILMANQPNWWSTQFIKT